MALEDEEREDDDWGSVESWDPRCDSGLRSRRGGLTVCRLCAGICSQYPPEDAEGGRGEGKWYKRGTCYTFFRPRKEEKRVVVSGPIKMTIFRRQD